MNTLEPDRATLQAWLQTFSTMALDELDALGSAPAVGKIGAEGNAIANAVSLPIREEGRPPAALAAAIARAANASLNGLPPASSSSKRCPMRTIMALGNRE